MFRSKAQEQFLSESHKQDRTTRLFRNLLLVYLVVQLPISARAELVLFITLSVFYRSVGPGRWTFVSTILCYKQCCMNALAHKPLRVCKFIERIPGSEIAVSQSMCVQFSCLITSKYY